MKPNQAVEFQFFKIVVFINTKYVASNLKKVIQPPSGSEPTDIGQLSTSAPQQATIGYYSRQHIYRSKYSVYSVKDRSLMCFQHVDRLRHSRCFHPGQKSLTKRCTVHSGV